MNCQCDLLRKTTDNSNNNFTAKIILFNMVHPQKGQNRHVRIVYLVQRSWSSCKCFKTIADSEMEGLVEAII